MKEAKAVFNLDLDSLWYSSYVSSMKELTNKHEQEDPKTPNKRKKAYEARCNRGGEERRGKI